MTWAGGGTFTELWLHGPVEGLRSQAYNFACCSQKMCFSPINIQEKFAFDLRFSSEPFVHPLHI